MSSPEADQGEQHQQHRIDGAALIDSAADREKRAKSEEKRRKSRRRKLQVSFNGILMVATLVIAGIGSYQAYVSKRSADAAERAANAATTAVGAASDQTKLLRKQLQATIGGILHIDPLSFNPPFRTSANWFYVSFTNTGHITATDIRATMLISIRSIPGNKVLGKIQTFSDPIPNIAQLPADPARQGGPIGRFQWRGVYLLTPREAEMLNSGHAALIADMSVSYNDGFEATRDGDCWAYLEGRNPFRCGTLTGEIARWIETQEGNATK